jgi:hypothetical protein
MIQKKAENEDIGFQYHVSMEQIREHRKKTPEEILLWIESCASLLQAFQSEEDKSRMQKLKNKKTTLD